MDSHSYKIDRNSPIPVYYQVELDLKNRILKGEWDGFDKLPTEVDLAKQYDISRLTLRQSIAELEKNGMIRRERGKGLYIEENNEPFFLTLSYSVASQHPSKTRITATLLEKKIITDLFPTVADKLKLKSTDNVVYIKRVFNYNNRPIAICTSYINEKYVPNFANKELIDNSIVKSLKKYYNISVSNVDDTLEAIRPSQTECKLLKLTYNVPLISIKGLSFINNTAPLEYSRTVWSGDSVKFTIPLKNTGNNLIELI